MPFWNKKSQNQLSELSKTVESELQQLKVTCPKCKKVYSGKEAFEHLYICPECGKYMPIGAKERLVMILDEGSFEPWFEDVLTGNPLDTAGYESKIVTIQQKSGCSEAVTIGRGRIAGHETVIGVCDPNFMMGSMGQAMGERITRAFEKATRLKLPVILFCCSGGARMQEGIISLMQMEKTSAAVKLHSDAGLFYCSVLTDPTMGGVTASFSTLADVILAEPQARIGFAGPRVIQQTIGATLPQGFQTAEFQLEHGFVDRLVERKNLRNELHYLLYAHPVRSKDWFRLRTSVPVPKHELDAESIELMNRHDKTPWDKVKMCRSGERATATDYIMRIFKDFREMHGDRYFGDDQALVGGIAFLGATPVTIIADLRGKSFEERVRRNFGMPKPEGYRKAIRLMKQAEKFRRPVISFINTSGAFCGIDAEERGQGQAIAQSIMEMSMLKTPTLSILIGEGGSGGALATAVGNEVWMLEHSTYAILSPEGYSAILWKTEGKAEEAAAVMKITAQDLAELGVIDRIIPEFGGATEVTAQKISTIMSKAISDLIKKYENMTGEEIVADRYSRFRKF
ncbi:MAG: acetyl-CoA carboxylase carboxyl transferase subunit alpha [Ruminococcaceae bacterium]|nr:acetyl-CoA carboxylase carboxyl transferase subunit alpha [Oscillospiraceae bacterium]